MIYRFRRSIIGPLVIFWLTVTVASVVIGAIAWGRFFRTVEASAEAEQLRESMDQLFSVLQDAEAASAATCSPGRRFIVMPIRTRPALFQRPWSGWLRPGGDAYAIGQMERQLAVFPKLAESIETSAAQATGMSARRILAAHVS